MSSMLLATVVLASVSVVPVGDLSDETIRQWEISSAVLPGDLADARCSLGLRRAGDPQFFVSWVHGNQRIMSCSMTELGTPRCESSTGTAQSLPGPCNWPVQAEEYIAGSNDNVMVRLADGRIVQIVQTIKLMCPPSNQDGIDNDGDGVTDETDPGFNGLDDDADGVTDETDEQGHEDGIDNDGDGLIDEDDEKGEFPACIYDGRVPQDREQVAYYVRISDDCGATWHPSVLDARDMVDLSGNPLAPSLGGFDRVEAYADPFSDHVLLTAAATYDECGWQQDGELVMHASTSGGATSLNWQRLFPEPSPFSSPLVMTSMPLSGGGSRVYWFNCPNWHPTLYVMGDPWNQGGTVPPVPHILDVPLGAAHPGENFACDMLFEAQGETALRSKILNLGLARVASDGITDTVRVVYPQTFFDQGQKYQKLRVVDVDVTPDGTGGFTVAPRKEAEILPSAASSFYPSFIQADRTTEDDPVAATQILRWTELGDSGTMREMMRAWDPVAHWSPDVVLDTWDCSGDCSGGDYQYGAFIDTVDKCTHRFFVPWGAQQDNNANGIWDPPPDELETNASIVTTTTDEVAPLLDPAPPDVTVECSEIPDPPTPGATDNCDPDPEIVFDEPFTVPGSCPQNFTLTRRWTATDNVGRVAVESQQITVQDTTAPALDAAPPDTIVECDSVPAAADLNATDLCDDTISVAHSENRIDGSCPSNYILERSWTAEDDCGNRSMEDRTVTARDTTPPVVLAGADDLYCLWPPNHDYVCFQQSQFDPVIADNCGATSSWVFTGCASDQPDDDSGDGHTVNDCVVRPDGAAFCVRAERSGSIAAARRYAVSIAATDECGNTGTSTVIGHVYVPHDQNPAAVCIDAAERGCGSTDPASCLTGP